MTLPVPLPIEGAAREIVARPLTWSDLDPAKCMTGWNVRGKAATKYAVRVGAILGRDHGLVGEFLLVFVLSQSRLRGDSYSGWRGRPREQEPVKWMT